MADGERCCVQGRAAGGSAALHTAYLGGDWAMIHTVVSAEIDAPPERVAALYADYEGWLRLFPATIRGVRLVATDGQRKSIEVDHATGRFNPLNIANLLAPRSSSPKTEAPGPHR
jgi:hypothetical protein